MNLNGAFTALKQAFIHPTQVSHGHARACPGGGAETSAGGAQTRTAESMRETTVNTNTLFTKRLRGGTALQALALLGAGVAFAAPAQAQDTPPTTTTTQDDATAQDEGDAIVVTGSLLTTADNSPSPVTTLTATTLQERGINTVAEAVQRVSANGMGAITQGWNNGNNFASGANAVSLRGLTVQSTLTIFDGMRMAPYPLADDGHRNFVDLNTIPNAIIDRIEVLRDGASSTYGADAVAGVVNVITKKQITGLHLNASAGISGEGDAGEQRVDVTWGYGDLDTQGFNFYINAEYQRNEMLFARDRDFPFNTADFSSMCAPSVGRGVVGEANYVAPGTVVCRANGIQNSVRPSNISPTGYVFNGLFATPVGVARQIGADGSILGRFNLINPAAGCREFTPVQVAPNLSTTAGALQCSRDARALYSTLMPAQERLGGAMRFTANIGDRAQFYATANIYQVDTDTQAAPGNFAGTTPPPTQFTLNPVYLPVYVCTAGVGSTSMLNTGCNASNGTLNPNNPFAAAGNRAQLLIGYDRPRELSTRARSIRGAMGIDGSFGDDWNYSVEATISNVQLDVTNRNVLIPGRIMDVIAKGTYNFMDQSLNGEDIRNYIAPTQTNRSNSDLWQVSATLSKSLFDLPGGPLAAAVGASFRHESINNPSANPANALSPEDRYYVLNAVGAIGARDVRSAFFEINAPVLNELEINLSGRYDDYSSGQSNFSPKVGAKFTPIEQFSLRGTYSKGFRIPSFNEAYGLPTTGYVTRALNQSAPYWAGFANQHLDPSGQPNSYATGQFSIGQTSIGNPGLKPEKSTSWTVGAIFEPTSSLRFTVDYWNIEVRDLIAAATYDINEVISQYYSNNGVVNVPGVVVRPGLVDPANQTALPHIGFIEASFQNTDSQNVSGIDFGATLRVPVSSTITWSSSFEATYLINFDRNLPAGRQSYEGTLSPCDVTSCSGAPQWRGNWQNTLKIADTTVTLTAYYTDGYDLASIDYGGVKGDCDASRGISVVTYEDGTTPVLCNADAQWNVDLTLNQKINDQFSLFANVLNVFDIDPVFDPSAAYSIFQFNPAWGGPNIMGRYFRVGGRVNF